MAEHGLVPITRGMRCRNRPGSRMLVWRAIQASAPSRERDETRGGRVRPQEGATACTRVVWCDRDRLPHGRSRGGKRLLERSPGLSRPGDGRRALHRSHGAGGSARDPHPAGGLPEWVHLDIETDDIDAEVTRLEALRAKRVARVRTWWVMEAPTGQRFCVIRPQNEGFAARALTRGP